MIAARAHGRSDSIACGAGAVVADVRVGEGDQLARERRVGHRLLVAGHAGREDDLAGRVASARPARVAVEAGAVLEQDVGARAASQPTTSSTRVAVGDPPAASVSSDLAVQPPAVEAAVGRAALVAAGSPTSHSRGEVDQRQVRLGARRRSAAPGSRTARRRTSAARRPGRASGRRAGRARCRRRRTRSRGRSCPSAPARTGPPSRRARAGRGRWRCSRSCRRRRPSISAWRSALGAQRRVHLHPRVERADVVVGQAQVVRRGLAGDGDAGRLGLPRSPRPTRRRCRCWMWIAPSS